ncbi:MAG: hypothetical protein U0401_15260 [Anaerolineae bacterium]
MLSWFSNGLQQIGNPFETTSIYVLIHYLEREWGVHYAMGGTGAVVQGLGC